MKNNTIFYRVLQLDKNVYGELVMEQSSLQKGLAIWLSGSIISTLAVTTFLKSQLFGFINVVVSIIIIFAVLKYFFRRDPNIIFIGVIYGFSSIPVLLNAPILFFNSLTLQGMVLVATSIFSLVCLGSGLKQVYMLRNIEVVLLILFSGFSSLVAI